jgi:hypothetical protein
LAALPKVTPDPTAGFKGQFAPEFRLVLACVHWPLRPQDSEEIRHLTSQPIDWQWFERILNIHQVLPLAYRSLRAAAPKSIPPELAARLHNDVMLGAHRSLSQAAELVRLVKQFEDRGIEVTALKGVPLSILAYKNPAMRECFDLDLLISPAGVFEAERILLESGYRRISPKARLTPKRWKYHLKYYKDFTYYSEVQGFAVEVHYRLFKSALLPLQSEDEALSTARIPLASSTVTALCGDDLFLYLCVHGAIHAWVILKWLADLGALLSAMTDEDLKRMIARSLRIGAAAELSAALILLHRFLGIDRRSADLPGEADPFVHRIVSFSNLSLTRNDYCQGIEKRPGFGMFLYTLGLRPSWSYRRRCLADNVVYPKDWELIDLPDALFPLYLGLRPFSWLMRHRPSTTLKFRKR